MKKETKNILIAVGVGSLITYLYFQNKNKVINPEVIIKPELTVKKGDFSKEVEELQILINKLFGAETIEVTGAYDKKTKDLVRLIFYNTKELTNIELGEVSVSSIKFLNNLLDNIQSKNKDE